MSALFVCRECRTGHCERCQGTVLHSLGERPCACRECTGEEDDDA